MAQTAALPLALTGSAVPLNSSFSRVLPTLQLAWDSTSLGLLKECPRKYELSMVQGWEPRRTSVHLIFGQIFHSALETYDWAKCFGLSHDDAQLIAVAHALEATWDPVLHRPWASDDPNKNRLTLVRSVSWYLEQFAEDPFTTVVLTNGKPAVELSFRTSLPLRAESTGENFWLCGHLDRVVEWNGDIWLVDRKTSKSQINSDFFEKFTPDNQFSLYSFAASVVYSMPARGLIVDGAQIAVTFTRFQRGIVERTESQLAEWYRDFAFWLRQAEVYAEAEYWPMNDKACGNYGGCQFRNICSHPPATRDQWLKANYRKRVWDPLQIRGDI